MKMAILSGLAVGLLTVVAPAFAREPELAVYVSDAGEDVFVALYGDLAIELAACEGIREARGLLQLPPETAARETTLARLTSDFGFGSRPRLPCGANAAFDMDWPATTRIWADVQGSGNYFLPAPDGGGPFYAVPARCAGIKTALAIRERLQLPGVLQGVTAPEGLGAVVVLDCGTAAAAEEQRRTPEGAGRLSLHRFDALLSAESVIDTIYVARSLPPGEGAAPVYAPVWRIDGRSSSDIIRSGGGPASEAEAALKDLFGIPAAAPVTPLGGEAVAAVRSAAHLDLCFARCEDYVHRHAAFLNPEQDVGLTELPAAVVSRRLNRLGEQQVVWKFWAGREAVFTDCDRVSAALGWGAPGEGADWLASVEGAADERSPAGADFACQARPAEVCSRRVAEGSNLSPALFSAGADCPGARHLRVELPSVVRMSAPLSLSGTDFSTIELFPGPGISRSLVTGVPGPLAAGTGSCVLSSMESLLLADRLPRLEMRNVTLRRADGSARGEVVALQIHNGALVLDRSEVGGDAEGTAPLERGVTLCRADLYAANSTVDATSLGIQAVSARVLLSGTASAPALVAQPRYGVLLSAGSTARLHQARITAATPLVLRGGRVVATRAELSAAEPPLGGATGLMLELGASAAFTTSTAKGFRCVASFADTASKATFILPGNDLTRDNSLLACGPGRFELIE